ncbi:hypothetical protein [Arsenophonus endosymbiont of Crataerina pallida]|uniref:hypothetical protein n=1 Tax=Arsenophonus endosymbiont of Crataerina pallida TaxID=3066235 RepID=UPI0030CDD899
MTKIKEYFTVQKSSWLFPSSEITIVPTKNSLIINELNQQRKNSRQHINTLKTQLIQNITKNKLNTLINQRKQQITDLLTSMQTTTHAFEQFKFPPPTSGEKLIYWQQQNQNNRVDYYFTILASYYQLIAFIENLQKTHPLLLIHQLKITPKKIIYIANSFFHP